MWLSLLVEVAVAQDRQPIADAHVLTMVQELSWQHPYTYVVSASVLHDRMSEVAVFQYGMHVGVPSRSPCKLSEPAGVIMLDCTQNEQGAATLIIGTDPEVLRLPPARWLAPSSGDGYYLVWISPRPNFAIDIPFNEE